MSLPDFQCKSYLAGPGAAHRFVFGQKRATIGMLTLLLLLGPIRSGAQDRSSGLPGANPLLTNASQILELTVEKAALHNPVRLRGVMTYVDPRGKFGFIQDETAGTVLFWTNALAPVRAGELVEVFGKTDSNVYTATIVSPVFRTLGAGQFPKALKPSFSDLHAGRADCQWTEVQGIVRSATADDDYLVLELAVERRRFKVSVLVTNEMNAERWVETRVRVRGVACGSFNGKGQFIGAELLTPSLEHVTVLERPRSNPYTLPLTPVSSLGHKSEKPPGQRIHLQGVATLFMPGEALYMRDGDESIEVRTTQNDPVQPGDLVDVIGFYERAEHALVIEDANFRRITNGPAPSPQTATVADLNSGRMDAELVTIPATLLEWRHGPSGRTLSLKADNVIFNASLDNGPGAVEFPVGSLVQLTGVCVVATDRSLNVRTFELRLRSPGDLVLLKPPAWWTTRHIYWVVGGVAALVLFVIGRAMVLARSNSRLERRVAHRTEALQRENSERQRVEAALRESQSLYHSLVENIPVSIYRKDLEGRFTFANPHLYRIYSISAEQILGKTLFDLVPAQVAESYTREDETVIKTGKPLELDKEHRLTDGRLVHLHVLKTPVFDAEGRVVGTQGMLTDITDRKRAITELASERDLLQTLLENSPDHIYFKDLQSRFIKCSSKQAQRFGLKDENEILGKTDFDFFGEEHARSAFNDEQEIIRTGQAVVGKMEKESWKDGGKASWVLTSKMPLRSKTGEIIGTFGISKDITDIKEAEAQLQAVHGQLVDASRRAGMAEVATSVLHNVGNVLNSVNTSAGVLMDQVRTSKLPGVGRVANLLEQHHANLAEFLTRDERGSQLIPYLKTLSQRLDDERSSFLQELRDLVKNIEHIKEIVAMQQSYARVAGVLEKLSLPALIEDALRMHIGALQRHHVHVVKRFEQVPDAHVDKHKVLQILVNLVSNAKYALAESTAPEKILTLGIAMKGPNLLTITVEDNGMGIAPENLTRIFSHGFTTRSDGHGFGLHSGALAAKEMGGSLRAHSNGPGLGARFTLELPIDPVDKKPTGASLESDFATVGEASIPAR